MDSPVAGWAKEDEIFRCRHSALNGLREGNPMMRFNYFESEDGLRLEAAGFAAQLSILCAEGLLGRLTQAGVTLTLIVRVELSSALGTRLASGRLKSLSVGGRQAADVARLDFQLGSNL